jgi:predicted PurR-regulated permease PerM
MNPDSKLTPKSLIDAMIRVGLIAILAFLCVRVFSPFIALMAWALVLAVMLYPLHQRFARRLGGKQGLAATLIVVIGLLLLGGPVVTLGGSFVSDILDWKEAYQNHELAIPQPDSRVAGLPLIGEELYNAWNEAATNLPKFLEDHAQQLKEFSRGIFSAAGNMIGSIFLILGALIVAGIMMAFGKAGSNAMRRILIRVSGPFKGPQLQSLIVATVRSVATGVLGVAFIQALLFGIGFLLAGIPAAGVLAVVTLFIGIIQLPALLVALPVIIYLWAVGDASATANIFYTVYFILAGLSDNVLKPLLLGRGVEAPMPVILIGALGGMVIGGFIGLFLGAILLAVGYRIFMDWVDDAEDPTTASSAQTDPAGEAIPGE